jgi:hypothetical protein
MKIVGRPGGVLLDNQLPAILLAAGQLLFARPRELMTKRAIDEPQPKVRKRATFGFLRTLAVREIISENVE